eukprot:jgi/Botrbrau1/8815/Bobra.0335s0005.1
MGNSSDLDCRGSTEPGYNRGGDVHGEVGEALAAFAGNYLKSSKIYEYEKNSKRVSTVVGLLLPRGSLFVEFASALLETETVFLPLDPAWPDGTLERLLAAVQPDVLVQDSVGEDNDRSYLKCYRRWFIPSSYAAHAGSSEGVEIWDPGEGGKRASASLVGRFLEVLPEVAAGRQAGIPQEVPLEDPPWVPPCAAYIMATSGSRGKPRLVLGTRLGIFNRIAWMQRVWPFLPTDVVAIKTAPTFVDSIWEMFGPLSSGSGLVFIPQGAVMDPAYLLHLLIRHGITHMVAVPSLLRALVPHLRSLRLAGAGYPRLPLKMLISSGEPLRESLLRDLVAELPQESRLLNIYGSTEVGADATWMDATAWLRSPRGLHEGTARGDRVPAGWPLDNTVVFIARLDLARGGSPHRSRSSQCVSEPGPANVFPNQDLPPHDAAAGSERTSSGLDLNQESLNPQAGERALKVAQWGEEGEICVWGAGVAAGYLGATSESFFEVSGDLQRRLRDPGAAVLRGHMTLPQETLDRCQGFRTGDLGRAHPSYGLLVLSRLDDLVKVRGVRVSLTEVEEVLRKHPKVQEAAVRLWPALLDRGTLLAAYVEVAADGEVMPEVLLEWCELRLPAAAVPSSIAILDLLPHGPAGKIAKSELPRPNWSMPLGDISLQAPSQGPSDPQGDLSVRSSGSGNPLPNQASQGPVEDAGSLPDEAWGASAVAGVPSSDKANVEAGLPDQTSRRAEGEVSAARLPDQASRVSENGVGAARLPDQAGRWVEGGVLAAFAAVLGFAPEPADDFFLVGGDSMAAAAVSSLLGIPVVSLHSCRSARRLSRYLLQGDPLDALGRSKRQSPQTSVPSPKRRRLIWKATQETRPPEAGASQGPVPAEGGIILMPLGLAKIVDAAQPVAFEGSTERQGQDTLRCAEPCGHISRGDPDGDIPLCMWRVKLRDCVDAAPLVLYQGPEKWWVWACSHGGSVVCVYGPSGKTVWRVELGSRAETGLVLTSNLQVIMVACASTLRYMRAATGESLAELCLAGDIRSAPARDPWRGHVWVGSHAPGRQLSICSAGSVEELLEAGLDVVQEVDCGGAVSASPVFDGGRKQAYVATLTGALVALHVTEGDSVYRVVWTRGQGGLPIFGTPAVEPSSGNVIIARAGLGDVEAFSSEGSSLWSVRLQTPVYSPVTLMSPLSSGDGPSIAVVGTQAGNLHFLDVSRGSHMGSFTPELPGTGTIRAGVGVELCPHTAMDIAALREPPLRVANSHVTRVEATGRGTCVRGPDGERCQEDSPSPNGDRGGSSVSPGASCVQSRSVEDPQQGVVEKGSAPSGGLSTLGEARMSNWVVEFMPEGTRTGGGDLTGRPFQGTSDKRSLPGDRITERAPLCTHAPPLQLYNLLEDAVASRVVYCRSDGLVETLNISVASAWSQGLALGATQGRQSKEEMREPPDELKVREGLPGGDLPPRFFSEGNTYGSRLHLEESHRSPQGTNGREACTPRGSKRVELGPEIDSVEGRPLPPGTLSAGRAGGTFLQNQHEFAATEVGSTASYSASAGPHSGTGTAPRLAVESLCGGCLPGEVFSSPVFFDGHVLVGCRDDHLYCVRIPTRV